MARRTLEQAPVDIRQVIDKNALLAKTRRLDLSFNELLDMYVANELEIRPEFQRVFAWGLEKQSQLVESLLLELPVPPIYVMEVEEGRYELVDGLQRLSSYFHFRGVLENSKKKIKPGDTFRLEGCDIVHELNGLRWGDLPLALQIRLKRAFVTVQVIRRESDKHYKYHMFKRLNSGGVGLSAHQIRNATVRMLGEKFVNFVREMSRVSVFVACCGDCITDDQRDAQFDEELVLRFFALKNLRQDFKHDVEPFLTKYMERVTDAEAENHLPFDYEGEKRVFEKTFQTINAATGEMSFTFPNKKGLALTAGFSVYHFEAVSIGIQKWLQQIDVNREEQIAALKGALETARLSQLFATFSRGGGKNSPGPLNKRIEVIETAVGKVFGKK